MITFIKEEYCIRMSIKYDNKNIKLISDFLKMGHTKNNFKEKNHEKQLKQILYDNGFIQVEKKEKKSENKPLKYFIQEPNGSQLPPDFVIYDNSKILNIECKSCKGTKKTPLWNSTYPQPNTLYIYSNEISTILFTSEDIVPENVKKIYDTFEKEYEDLCNKINNSLNLLEDNYYKMNVYGRKMFIQKIGFKQQSDYMKNIENLDFFR